MNLLRWWFLFLTLVSLSCGLGWDDSHCDLRQLESNTKAIHCRSKNNSSGFYILFADEEFIVIRCSFTLDLSDSQYRAFWEKYMDINSESCQLLESHQIDFIRKVSPITRIKKLGFISLNMDVALNISRSILSDFENIEELYLFGINFSEIPSDYLQEFGKNLSLHLSKSVFDKQSKDHSVLTISSMVLWDNDLEVIDSNTFGEIENIQRLDIEEKKLFQIMPNSFDKMVSLTSITIKWGLLESLPENLFASLKNLTFLDLTGNHFLHDLLTSKLLQNHNKLVKLELNFNKGGLSILPNRFLANMTHLQEVIMTRNGLVTLPADLFSGSIELLSLDLSRNEINVLPVGIFSDQENLSSLDLSNNKIVIFPAGIFSNQKSLESLDLSNNRITKISSSAFKGSKFIGASDMEGNNSHIIKNMNFSIDILEISYNDIFQTPHDWFFYNNLRLLDLSYNKLKEFSIGDFGFGFFNLTVDLRNNKINYISIANVEDVGEFNHRSSKNVSIYIDDNPIECNCHLDDLLVLSQRNIDLPIIHPFLSSICPLELQESSLCLISDPQTINATCPENCECWKRWDNQGLHIYIIDCSSRGFYKAPEEIKGPAKYQIELNMTNNSLTNIPSLSQPGYDKVTDLLLSHNKINNIPFQSLFGNLRILELHNNKLSRIDTSILNHLERSTNLKKLTLHNNLWECNCEQREFLRFIHATRLKLVDLNNVTCGEMKQKFFLTPSEDLCPNNLLIISCIGIALFGMIIAMYYRYQQEIKIWLYARQWCLWLVSEDELDRDKIYDAFISYSHQDDDFVVNELVAKLEEGPKPFKLCVHYRDWLPGEWIPNQVARSVENSKRTVIVLSANFIHSEWGRMEFRAAHSQALSDGRTRVIVIIYGEIPPLEDLDSELRAYLTMNTYVKWGDPWFWRKIRYALPHRS